MAALPWIGACSPRRASSARRSKLAEKALKLDPKLVEAQELLARLALEDSNPEKAAEEADKALKMSPEALDAMAIHASIDLLADKTDEPWFDKIAGDQSRSTARRTRSPATSSS